MILNWIKLFIYLFIVIFELFYICNHVIILFNYFSKWNTFYYQFKPIQYIFAYFYKYTRATYDWFCGQGSYI